MALHPVRYLALISVLCLLAPPLAYSQSVQGSRILVFSKTSGFRHPSISTGQTVIAELADSNGFTADFTDSSGAFNASNLAQYDAVIWLNTSGNVLYGGQQTLSLIHI